MLSPILRLPYGVLNNVNDPFPGSLGSSSQWPPPIGFPGQLGKEIDIPQEEVRYDSTLGTVYGGRFMYVRLAAASTVPAVGQVVFWDNAADPSLYQVTLDETTTTYVAASAAGIILTPSLTAGNYTLIQRAGLVKALYVPSVTGTKAIGRPVVISQAGTTSIGNVDIDDTPAPELLLGYAVELPTDDSLKTISLLYISPRG